MRAGTTNKVSFASAHAPLSQHLLKSRVPGKTKKQHKNNRLLTAMRSEYNLLHRRPMCKVLFRAIKQINAEKISGSLVLFCSIYRILLQLFAHVQEITLQQNFLSIAYPNFRLYSLTYLLTYLLNLFHHYDGDVVVIIIIIIMRKFI